MNNVTYSVSETTGIIPSITFSSFVLFPETSHTMIFPSAPHVVYLQVGIKQAFHEARYAPRVLLMDAMLPCEPP